MITVSFGTEASAYAKSSCVPRGSRLSRVAQSERRALVCWADDHQFTHLAPSVEYNEAHLCARTGKQAAPQHQHIFLGKESNKQGDRHRPKPNPPLVHLGAVTDDPAMLLGRTRQEPGHVHKGQQGHVERVAEPNKSRRLQCRREQKSPKPRPAERQQATNQGRKRPEWKRRLWPWRRGHTFAEKIPKRSRVHRRGRLHLGTTINVCPSTSHRMKPSTPKLVEETKQKNISMGQTSPHRTAPHRNKKESNRDKFSKRKKRKTLRRTLNAGVRLISTALQGDPRPQWRGRKRLALVEVSMSRQPAKNMGLFATIPTGCPSILAKPTVMFFAQSGMISKYVLSSTTFHRALHTKNNKATWVDRVNQIRFSRYPTRFTQERVTSTPTEHVGRDTHAATGEASLFLSLQLRRSEHGMEPG